MYNPMKKGKNAAAVKSEIKNLYYREKCRFSMKGCKKQFEKKIFFSHMYVCIFEK